MQPRWTGLTEAEKIAEKAWTTAESAATAGSTRQMQMQVGRKPLNLFYDPSAISASEVFSFWMGGPEASGVSGLAAQDRIAGLEKRIEYLEKQIGILQKSKTKLKQERVIVLRQVTREQAKEEVKRLFSTGRTLYYSDIARRLKVDLQLVVEICRELQDEGEIEVAKH